MKQPASRGQRSFCLSPGDFRMIVLLRQMRQHYKRCTIIIVASKEIREGHIGQVPYPAHYPLFYRPRIRPHPQHLQVVIRLHDQHIAAAQMIAHADRNVSQIGRNPDLDAFRAKRESHRIRRIMRNGERLDRDVAHLKAVPGFEALELFQLAGASPFSSRSARDHA